MLGKFMDQLYVKMFKYKLGEILTDSFYFGNSSTPARLIALTLPKKFSKFSALLGPSQNLLKEGPPVSYPFSLSMAGNSSPMCLISPAE